MMASVDGRIDCDMTEKIEGSDAYYEAMAQLEVPTTAMGRVTAAMHYALPGAFAPSNNAPVAEERTFKATDSAGYSVVFDTNGSLLWDNNQLDNCPLVCVVSEAATADYLDYLQQKGISYIATGKGSLSLRRAAELLARDFGVERMGLVGGGKINGAFLQAGLIDEMSLMIAPGIDGRTGQPSVFDGIEASAEPVRLTMKNVKAFDCGTVWIRYSVNK